MKKMTFILASVATTLMADNHCFEENVHMVSTGIKMYYGDDQAGVSGVWDRGVFDGVFSMGAGIDAAFGKVWTYLSPSLRFGLHYGVQFFDPYIVVYSGVETIIVDKESDSKFFYDIALGLRVHFHEIVGLWAEGDLDKLTLGINMKLYSKKY